MLEDFNKEYIIVDHIHRETLAGDYPDACEAVLSRDDMAAAGNAITLWSDYEPTPPVALDALVRELALSGISYEDEARRFDLGSFKALGGAYAAFRFVADKIRAKTGQQPSLADIRRGKCGTVVGSITVTTATDGNQGRSVAWVARLAGCMCRIYIHAGVSEGRQHAMEELGDQVARIDGDYDETLRRCIAYASADGWQIPSDTSFRGYMNVPRTIMAGYGVLAREIETFLGERIPTHVFVQAGVGGLAASLLAQLWQERHELRPRFIVVEPADAACC